MATRVDQLKDRIIDMIDGGLTRFGFTTGPDWHKLTIEEKADAILTMWDVPKVAGPPLTGRQPRLIADVVAELQRDEFKDKAASVKRGKG
jgi:hypothetical protein